MKLVTAVVRPERLDDVIRAVSAAGARGLTATEAKGFGQQYGHMGSPAPPDWQAALRPKLEIRVLVHEAIADHVASAIAKAVNTGTIGDGKIWVSPVDTAIRVRTGERGEGAV